MSEETWTAVDAYLGSLFLPSDAPLEEALRASAEAGLPPINVSPLQGKLLFLLAKAQQATRILEIGTLGGYSTIWLARAVPPGGQLISLELNPTHAAVARRNVARAGLAEVVEIRLGPAQESLETLAREGQAPFDFIFIDADKPGYSDYFALSLKLARRGTMIVADNVVRDGEVADPRSGDPNVQAVRLYNALIAADPRVSATVLQTVGSKGYDGLALALVTADRV